MERLTQRDIKTMEFIARVGFVRHEDLLRRFEISRATAYRRLRKLINFGLIELVPNLGLAPLYFATADGIEVVGLPLRPETPNIATVTHGLAMTEVVTAFDLICPDCLTEREIRAHRRVTGDSRYLFQLVAPASIHWRHHRPDIIVELAGYDTFFAIEVEISPKSARRWTDILWSYSSRVAVDGFAGVLYLTDGRVSQKQLRKLAGESGLGGNFHVAPIASNVTDEMLRLIKTTTAPRTRSAA